MTTDADVLAWLIGDFLLANNTNILSRTVFQLPRSSSQIIAFDKGVPLVNAFVLSNLCEYCHKLDITKN